MTKPPGTPGSPGSALKSLVFSGRSPGSEPGSDDGSPGSGSRHPSVQSPRRSYVAETRRDMPKRPALPALATGLSLGLWPFMIALGDAHGFQEGFAVSVERAEGVPSRPDGAIL